jgi:hypothetical protein
MAVTLVVVGVFQMLGLVKVKDGAEGGIRGIGKLVKSADGTRG